MPIRHRNTSATNIVAKKQNARANIKNCEKMLFHLAGRRKELGNYIASQRPGWDLKPIKTMGNPNKIRCVLIMGSGPIVIGQACEFDYSGSQSVRAMKEEGVEVVLVNSNPATIMTDRSLADHIYLKPLEKSSIIDILERHDVDAVLPTMGGQVSLNLAMACEKEGIWKRYGVQMIGVEAATIRVTEDREAFRLKMESLGIPTCKGATASSFLQAKEVAQAIGFPLIIRASYTLGGSGGSIVTSPDDLQDAINRGLHASPIHEILIEESIAGWKEYELELLKDHAGNVIVVCCVENVDPVGIHTGDSITVSPPLTLPDRVYQQMRNVAKQVVRNIGNFAGGCNVQFAIHPEEEHLVIIEINPRVSRSSALAAKATGYPIAKVASKLALGYRLDALKNEVTKTTTAFFEPSLDYVIVKIPKWNFEKFQGSHRGLGFQMKSVGEVMGIGRHFQEALLKALDSLEIPLKSLLYEEKKIPARSIIDKLSNPSWDRIFYLFHAFRLGMSVEGLHAYTKIDPWFLYQLESLVHIEDAIKQYRLETLPMDLLKTAKGRGFSDAHLAYHLDCKVEKLTALRKRYKMERDYKTIDTCAAEFPTQTSYYYSTAFCSLENESVPLNKKKLLIVGAGPNRIGQGLEFDYCCVHGVLAAQACGYQTLMVNCNPETVSTDFDISDRLYFEPVQWEYVQRIIDLERPTGVLLQLGGQTSLKLARQIHDYGVKIMGTSYPDMDKAEDRVRFSELLRTQGIAYPAYGVATNATEARSLAKTLGFPLLVRPSYVLGGENMKIVINEEELEEHLIKLANKEGYRGNVIIDKFMEKATEAEIDALCDGEDTHIMGMMEHVEPAGIHSGDSYAVLPPYHLSTQVMDKMRQYTHALARALHVVGLINVQFVIKDEKVYVIEANPRASRTMPFICKAHQVPYVQYAVKMMLGAKVRDFVMTSQHKGYAIKEPVFSFDKFPNVNKELGPEMKSTGETISFIENAEDEYLTAIYAKRNLYLSR